MLLFFISFLYLQLLVFFILLLYLHLSMFFILLFFFIQIFFSMSSLILPWIIAEFLHLFYTFSPDHRRVIRDIFKHSIILFFTLWRFFTLRSFTDILTCVYQGFPGSRQFFLEVCRASYWSSNYRPGPSYSKQFGFKFYHILSWIACGESLIYLLLTHFELLSLVQSICEGY